VDFVQYSIPTTPCLWLVGRHEVEDCIARNLSASDDYDKAISRTDPTSGASSLWDNCLC
jgi:hypothetical protein